MVTDLVSVDREPMERMGWQGSWAKLDHRCVHDMHATLTLVSLSCIPEEC